MQGRVKPTLHMKGDVSINDDASLEREADVMGEKALAAPEIVPHDETQNVARPSSQAPVQRRVFVGDEPAINTSQTAALVGGKTVKLEGKGAEWVNDGYRRSYETLDEFQRHMQGEPVDRGLAKKLGLWYHLDFFSKKQFFVLGESHGAFGYRELVQESNQSGKVLGEGGYNPLLSATLLATNPDSAALSDQGGSRESTMENLAAKALYSLLHLQKTYGKQGQPVQGAQGVGPPKKEDLPEELWLKEYQNLPPGTGRERDTTGLPYFSRVSGARVYGTFGTKAENYEGNSTAFMLVEKLCNSLQQYADQGGNQTIEASTGSKHKIDAKKLRTDIEEFLRMKDDNAKAKKIADLVPLVKTLAYIEAERLNANNDPTSELIDRRKAVKTNLKKYTEDQQVAFAHRDYVMYKSVLKAKEVGGYIMAGMGNNHAKNLKHLI
jgi:hypothetical protein